MTHKKSAVCLILFFLGFFQLSGQDTAANDYSGLLGSLQELLETSSVYAILIDLEIYTVDDGKKELLTHSRDIRFTIHGSRVSLRYVVANVVIEGGITPYKSTKNKITLVTQSEVWVKTKDSADIHIPLFNNLNIQSGETLYYFPLGMLPETSENGFTIEIPIQVIEIADIEELIDLLDKINKND